jgi:NAD(P)-dependent dehydrogenase (short-subunit alcohol dehydrogenase family)
VPSGGRLCQLAKPGTNDCARRGHPRIKAAYVRDVYPARPFRSSGLEDITYQEWDKARLNEVGLLFYLTRAARPYLKSSHGVLVNMGSLNASLSFKILPSLAHTTNKAGTIGMTRQLALEAASMGFARIQSRRA